MTFKIKQIAEVRDGPTLIVDTAGALWRVTGGDFGRCVPVAPAFRVQSLHATPSQVVYAIDTTGRLHRACYRAGAAHSTLNFTQIMPQAAAEESK